MSRRDKVAVSSPPSEQKSEVETSKSLEEDQEDFTQETNSAPTCKVETALQLAERDQDVEDELLEASLEEYQ